MTSSAIYSGIIRHRRFVPISHHFEYKIFMMYIDLNELPELFKDQRFWSVEKFNLAYFRRQDYWGDPKIPLDTSIRQLVKTRCGVNVKGPIRLLTHLRYFAYSFNPASFYYCFSADGQEIEAIVIEVTNTPWSERYCYVLSKKENLGNTHRLKFEHDKKFHVSPFMPMDLFYRWQFLRPGKKLSIQIDNFKQQQKMFDATLTLQHKPLSSKNLNQVLINYPLLTARVSAGIYFEALRLWWKGAVFFPHPKKNKNRGVA